MVRVDGDCFKQAIGLREFLVNYSCVLAIDEGDIGNSHFWGPEIRDLLPLSFSLFRQLLLACEVFGTEFNDTQFEFLPFFSLTIKIYLCIEKRCSEQKHGLGKG